jgi:hypothetical protein
LHHFAHPIRFGVVAPHPIGRCTAHEAVDDHPRVAVAEDVVKDLAGQEEPVWPLRWAGCHGG